MSKVYGIVQEKILESLAQGVVPWHKPWKGGGIPMNLKSGKAYRGVNVFMLGMQGYASRYWVSWNQSKELSGYKKVKGKWVWKGPGPDPKHGVKAGEKATLVVFWKRNKVEDKETGETKWIPILRYYNVWNLEQCTGLTDPEAGPDREHTPLETAENIINGMPNKPTVKHEEQRAFYSLSGDFVNMPRAETFDCAEEYYSTLFHELGHSTRHKSRLDREKNSYAQEELVAEMTAAFLCGVCDIEDSTLDNSAAYIETWRKRISDEVKLVVLAGAQAQKAADYIQGIKWEKSEE